MGIKGETRIQLPDGTESRPLVESERLNPEIPFSEFVAAKQDPQVADFLESVKAQDRQLKQEGKIHF